MPDLVWFCATCQIVKNWKYTKKFWFSAHSRAVSKFLLVFKIEKNSKKISKFLDSKYFQLEKSTQNLDQKVGGKSCPWYENFCLWNLHKIFYAVKIGVSYFANHKTFNESSLFFCFLWFLFWTNPFNRCLLCFCLLRSFFFLTLVYCVDVPIIFYPTFLPLTDFYFLNLWSELLTLVLLAVFQR